MLVSATQNKAGPRAAAITNELDLFSLPAKRDYKRVQAFIESFLTMADGKPMRLKPFQVAFLRGLFPSSVSKRPRFGLWSLARGQGKTTLNAALAVYCLFADEVQSPEVLVIASTLEVAMRQIFRMASGFIQRNPDLAMRAKISRDTIVTPFNGGALYALASSENSLHGFGHSAAFIDEMHLVSPDVFEAISTASTKRDESLTLSISTPPRDSTSIMGSLMDAARKEPDASFFFKDYPTDNSHEPLCICCVKIARPLTGASKKEMGRLKTLLRKTPESTFRRLMLAQEGLSESDAWFTSLDIQSVTSSRRIANGERVVLAFDGSFNNDSSVVCAITIEAKPHIEIIKIWEPVEGSRVPIGDVEATILKAAETFKVEEITADPFRWSRSLEALESKLTVSHFPQTQARMGPAITSLHTAIMDGTCTIADDPVLVQHFLNCRVRDTDRGIALSKPGANGGKNSAEKIDAAVTSVMGFSRATHHASKVKAPSRASSFRYV